MENKIEIFESKENAKMTNNTNREIITIDGVECYELNGTAYLKLEAVAKGLGSTQTQNKNGKKYISIRWDRIEGYLAEIGFPHKWGKEDYIPENIFYRLAMKAKNAVAEAFQAKVADEIIPSIRKHGGYIAGQETMSNEDLLCKALLFAQSKIEEKDTLLEVQKPKVLFADAVASSDTTVLVGELAKLLKQNGVDIGQNRLFEWLRENGYLIKRGNSYNLPTKKSMELGLFEIKESVVPNQDNSVRVVRTTKVTGYGQQYFVNLFLKFGVA